MTHIPDDLKSDHLFLLMGQNPLPNYVSALLLTPKGRPVKIYLLHSRPEKAPQKKRNKGQGGTEFFANRLREMLKDKRPQAEVFLREITEANNIDITHKITSIIEGIPKDARVGLNYTGGTKPMAVHTYRQFAKTFSNPIFSYLDARDLAMYFDNRSYHPAGRLVEVNLNEMAMLHGYELPEDKIKRQPPHLPLVQALATVHQTDAGFEAWRAWVKLEEKILPDVADKQLGVVRQAMDAWCDGHATPKKLAQTFGYSELSSLSKWFNGGWLEELALDAILKNADSFKICDLGMSIEPVSTAAVNKNDEEFELDAAAIIGYRLFAVSCILSQKRGGNTKHHFLEIFTRARQLGGDEARVALVSYLSDADKRKLERQIKQEWHTENQIKVFGQTDLKDLPRAFRGWFKENEPIA